MMLFRRTGAKTSAGGPAGWAKPQRSDRHVGGSTRLPKLAANLSMMFNEIPFLERFGAAAAAGFGGVEFLFPYDYAPAEVADALRAAKTALALFNMPPGDWNAGERGLAAIPGRESEFAAGVDRALLYAEALGSPLVHALAGFADPADELAAATYVANVQRAADAFAPAGRRIVLEPINAHDMPGYFLRTSGQAIGLIERIDRPNVALQLDLYHTQITEGDLERKMRALAGRYAHVQIAGNPARNEPDVGEVNYTYLLGVFDAIGYVGWIGCEYRPAAGTTAGLGWAQPYLH